MDSGHSWNAHNTCTQCGTTTRAYTIHCPGDLDEKDRAEDRKAMNTPTASDGAVAWQQDWARTDGVTAFHLIERHANDWNHAGEMMDAWRVARNASQEYAYPPIDRAKLLALADRWDGIVLDGRRDYLAGKMSAFETCAAELRALLGGES